MTTEKPKRKQKPKKGRVFRLDDELAAIIEDEREPGETASDCVRRLFGSEEDVKYVLPSDLKESAAEARGAAILRAVKTREKRPEKPIAVRVK